MSWHNAVSCYTENRTCGAYIVMFFVGCRISDLFDRDESPILLICEGINALIDRGKDVLGHVALEMDWLDRLGISNRVHGRNLCLRRASSQLWHVQAQLSTLLYIVKIIKPRRGWAGIFSSNDSLTGVQLRHWRRYDGIIEVNKDARWTGLYGVRSSMKWTTGMWI